MATALPSGVRAAATDGRPCHSGLRRRSASEVVAFIQFIATHFPLSETPLTAHFFALSSHDSMPFVNGQKVARSGHVPR
jgi:hypothetical protein